MYFLSRLLDILFPPRDTETLVREATFESLAPLIRPRITRDCTTLLPYRHPLVRALVLEAKFRANKEAQRLLGHVLRDYLIEEDAVLVPIPLGRARLKERGYNQVEEIVKAAGRAPSCILIRTRETPAQTSSSGRLRRKNMEHAFVATGIDPAHTYIVIDDVMTTGATLRDATRALVAAGAVHIRMLTLAH